MGQALVCPKCKAGILEWINDDIDEADLSVEPMRCKSCKIIYKGFNEFNEAIGLKLKFPKNTTMMPAKVIMELHDVKHHLAGFDIAGYEQPDGSIVDPTSYHKLHKAPDVINYNGTGYTLEDKQYGETDPVKGKWVNLIYV